MNIEDALDLPRLKALVVDDDQGVRDTLAIALEREGFECATANNGVMALNRLRLFQADVVVTDLLMSKMHGHRLVAELSGLDPKPVIMVLTGVREPKLIKDLIGRGAADIMLKPLSADLVAAKVRAVMDCRRHARAVPASGHPRLDALREGLSNTAGELREHLRLITAEFEQTVKTLESEKTATEDGMVGSVRLFSQLIKLLGSCEGSHTSRVERMCVAVASAAGLPRKAILCLRVAALVHDLGQLGMPDFVRNKAPWELGPSEIATYRKYPSIGANLVDCVPRIKESAAIIESHCENFDGSGFPHGLAGADIPLGARILRIADGCDTRRVFHSARAPRDLAAHLRDRAGKDYDPGLVECAVACLSDGNGDGAAVELTDTLAEGMVLAENVYDTEGCFLIGNGARLSKSLISRISRMVPDRAFRVYAPQADGDGPGH